MNQTLRQFLSESHLMLPCTVKRQTSISVKQWESPTVSNTRTTEQLCSFSLSRYVNIRACRRAVLPPSRGRIRCWGRGLQRWGSCWRRTPGWRHRRGLPWARDCWYLRTQLSERGWSLFTSKQHHRHQWLSSLGFSLSNLRECVSGLRPG